MTTWTPPVFSIRVKLLLVFTGMTLLVVAVFALASYRLARTQALAQAGAALQDSAALHALLVGDFLEQQLEKLTAVGLHFEAPVAEQSAALAGDGATIRAALARQDAAWHAAADDDPLIRAYLENAMAGELRQYRRRFAENLDLILTDRFGGLLAATGRTPDFYHGDEPWWQAAYRDGAGAVYVGEPAVAGSDPTTTIIVAIPLHGPDSGRVEGVLRTTVDVALLLELLATASGGRTSRAELLLPSGAVLSGQDPASTPGPLDVAAVRGAPGNHPYAELLLAGVPRLASAAPVVSLKGATPVADLGWTVVVHQSRAESLAPLARQRRVIVILALALATAVAAATAMVTQWLTRPIAELTEAAERVRAGDLDARAPVNSRDEVGRLAATFNAMTAQLRQSLQELEQRVADRTRALVTSTEVSRRLSTILDQNQLVQQVVEQIKSAFDYYHVHIYLFDEGRSSLVLAGGTGEAGQALLARGHRLAPGLGLVGRSAATNGVVLAPDVRQDRDWLPNVLLPDTQAEIAVPIAIGAQVLGVLDVQHDVVNGLTAEDAGLLQSLASQVAVALQNARLYSQTQQQAAREALLNTVSQRIQRATSVEGVLQIAAQELGQALAARYTAVQLVNPALEGDGRGGQEQ